ncbi:transglutaminase domain-containing protein [Anaerobranca gottschalkii]|uniref:Transglutaminase-like superfamily protein n=1 Tax=Anaerobranca gottschalkii DSM 13577 TaxID=1120990 RepID=A0A1I0A2M2_9FIRM|nr:transglutaminase domain-containing protein [Anaerobranca gottschalkii]SES88354.1 Transglutaminase-like superfamily protein [Anaerobranca gottschalkii DSM 13577]
MIKKWVVKLWYLTFIIGLICYGMEQPTKGLFLLGLLWISFLGIDYFFEDSPLNLITKSILTLAIIYRSGQYSSLINPRWLQEVFLQLQGDITHFYYGRLQRMVALPIVTIALLNYAFQQIKFFQRVGKTFIVLLLFGGSSALLGLHLYTGYSTLNPLLLFIFLGMTLLFIENMESSALYKNNFKLPIAVMIVFLIVLNTIWSFERTIEVAQGLEEIKTFFTGGYSPVGENGEEGDNVERARVKRTGYSSNDKILGGPIVPSYQPALRVKTEKPVYLRGESSSFYTGRGWHRDILSYSSYHLSTIPVKKYPGVDYQEVTIEVEVLNNSYNVIFAGLNTKEVILPGKNSVMLINDSDILINGSIGRGDTYQVVMDYPTFSPDLLRQGGDYSDDFPLEKYTNLPFYFPSKIVNLAQELTKEYDNNYDKVIALKNYLLRGGFKYNLNVPYPPGDMDFVEHFLEIKEGYCVHFSTAFVMMARSLGIPARWVKGFAPGTPQGGGYYLVTDENAHAWAEVYFPNAGWVPFEVTPGFSSTGTGNGERRSEDDIDAGERDETPIENQPDLDKGENGVGKEEPDNNESEKTRNNLFWFFLGIGTLISFPLVIKHKESKLSTKEKVVRLYNKILSNFKLVGWGKGKGETPKEYVEKLKRKGKISTKVLDILTNEFQSVYYGNNNFENREYINLQKQGKEYSLIKLLSAKWKNRSNG